MTTHTYDNDEGLPVLTKKQTAHNEDGLPILKKQSSDLPIVKKKDLIGGTVSTDGSTEPKSISLTKEEQDDLDKRMGKVKPVEEHDEDFINDPVKNITQPLRNKLTQTNNEYRQSGLFNRNASESTNQTRVGNAGGLKESYERDLQNSYHQLDNVTDQVVKTLLPNGKKATEYAVHQIKKNGGIAPENNETFNIAAAKAGQYISLKDKLSNGKSLTQVGVDMERELDPNLDKQISVLEQDKNGGHRTGSSGLGTDIYDNILPGVTQGRITDRLMHQPDIDVISSENPKVKQEVNYLKNGGLYERFPDYGISEMSNELSRERQKIGKNNIIANPIFNSSKFMDNLAEQMYKDTPWKLKFYNEKFKNHLQGKIDTPGMVDEFGTGAKETFNQMGASLKDVVGLGDNAPDRIYNELEKEGSQVSSGVEGWRKWAGQAARFAGMIAAMSTASGALKATGLSPAAINGIVASDAFYDSERNSWTMKYPDEPLKAQLGAILTTAAFAAGGKAFPGGKVAEALSEKMAPEIKAALGNLEEGVISKKAKKGLIDKFGQFLKETVKGTGEATAIVAGVNAFENAFDQVAGDPQMIAKYHPDNKIIEDAKSMIIGSVFPQALIAAKNVGIVGNSLIDIADRPEVYEPNIKQLLDEGKITPEEYNKKLEDIALLSKTREILNQQGVTEANQKRALVETLNEKYKKERIANQPESAVTRRTQKEIRGSQEVQDKIMNGEDVVGDEVKSHLTPKENEIIDILKSKTELGNEKASEMGKALFNAVKDPENHKAIIKELVDQSSDPDALEINVGKKITDAVLSLSEKSTQKTVEELDNETKNIAESIKGNEPTKAGEATEPILTIDEGGKEPPKTPIESQAEPKEPNTVGIKHESLKKIAEKMGLPQPERGTFLTPEEQTKRGRLLLQGGADPEKIAIEFKDDGKINADIISVARAHFENLVKEQQAALDKYGKNSPQEAAARLAADKWATDITKPMATASGGALSAHIGETDLDTGSFVSIQRATEQETGKPIEKWQERKINELTAKNNELKKQTDDLEARLIEATNENIGKEKGKGTFTEKAKKAADVFRKLKTKPFKFKDENGNEHDVKQSGLPWNELVELGAKAIEKTGQIVDGVAEVINKIKDEVWYNKLSDKDKERLSSQLSEHFEDAVEETPEAKKVKRLEKELEKLQSGIVKQNGIKIEDTPEMSELKDKIFDAKKNLGLIKSKNLPTAKVEISKEQKIINRLEKTLDDLRQGIVKEKADKFEDTPAIKKLKEDIFEAKKELGLVPSKVKSVSSPSYGLKETPEVINVRRLEKELSDLQQGIAKQKSPSRELSEREKELKEKIKDERERLGLVPSKSEKPLTEDEIKEADRIELEDLQKQFVDKKGNKFTTDEAKAIWNHAKKNYLDKGSPYRDMIIGVANDFGLSWRQVNEAISSPKTKPISDAMWKKRGEYVRQQTAAKNWVNDQTANPALRALKKLSGVFRGVAVFGHGGIFVGTHAGMTFFQPSTLKYTIPAFFRGWKFAYGNTGVYEKRIEELKNSPNYTLAQRAGLKNNPDRINAEEYQKSQQYLGKLGLAGERGFNAIKILRQDLFDHEYNKLSDDAKQYPESAKNVAKLINNATGATNLKIPDWVNEASFAGGMEAARWGKLTRNPAKATSVALKALFAPDKATVSERVFAKVWAKRVGEQLATFTGALAANAAIQNTIHPNNPTNLTNPDKPDFLKFKFGNTTIDPTSGMRGVLSFIYGIGKIPFESKKQRHGDTVVQAAGKQTFGYGRGKLAPLYSTFADFYSKSDFGGNVMPFSDEKPAAGKHKLSWGEYAWEKAPLPIAEAASIAYKTAEDNGANKVQLNNVLNGIVSGAISGGTGFRVGEYNSEEAKHSPFTESDNKEPEFKYFLDKGLELPNTVHSSEEITDEKNHTKKSLSDYPKDIQKEYDELHKSFLKKELGNVINKNHVFVKEYTDAEGGSKDQVSFTHSIHSKRKSLDELDEEELAQVLKLSQAEATRKTKEKLFK